MRMKGYLEHINLGIDSESGEKAILVKSAREFFLLSEEEQYRAWSVVKVASEILERPPVTIYQYAYKGKMPSKIIKKNAFDRHGLTLVKVFNTLKTREARRAEDQERILKTLKRSLNRASWIPKGRRDLLVVQLNLALREIERVVLNKSKGITEEGKNGLQPVS